MLKYANINIIKTICINLTLPFKMEIRLNDTEKNVPKVTKNYELQN